MEKLILLRRKAGGIFLTRSPGFESVRVLTELLPIIRLFSLKIGIAVSNVKGN
jgi:hypothetical protein